jgi:NADH dehydrogenase
MEHNNFNLPLNGKERIVIVGGGFAGLKMARLLSGSKYQVVLIDKRNFHQFQPLFYQVATSGLEPSSISFPIRKVFHKHTNLHFRNTEFLSVHPKEKYINTSSGTLRYDYLVLALGVRTNYFGNSNIEQNSLPMKSTAAAINLRNNLLESFEAAILSEDSVWQETLLSINVVGGGPTGVELSGAIAELKNYVLPKDYPELDFTKMKIRLYEAGPRLLASMHEKSGKAALKFLTKLGVEVHLNTMIKDFNQDTIILSDNSKVSCKNLLWTAGVKGRPVNGFNDDQYVRGNRLKVNRYNQLYGYDDIFAIGDICYMETPEHPNGHPQVAQVALQQGKLLAQNLQREKLLEFEYKDKGSMATIGRNMAVVDLPGIRFAGKLAWFMWLFVHLMAIVGVKNRLFIFINWAQSYIMRDQSLRVLIRPFKSQR